MKMNKNILFISEDYIKTNSTLSDNYFGKYLLPAIVEAQNMGLQYVIGECLYNKLVELVDTNEIQDAVNQKYKDLMDLYVQDYLLYEVLSNSVFYSNIKLANMGTTVSKDEYIQTLTQKDIDLIQHNFRNKANFCKRRLQEFLLNNRTAFPELNCDSNCNYSVKPHLYYTDNCDIYLK